MEAARLYEQGGLFEKAAALYISLKMFTNATPLMSKIKSPKLLTLYAKVTKSLVPGPCNIFFLGRPRKVKGITKMQRMLMKRRRIGKTLSESI